MAEGITRRPAFWRSGTSVLLVLVLVAAGGCGGKGTSTATTGAPTTTSSASTAAPTTAPPTSATPATSAPSSSTSSTNPAARIAADRRLAARQLLVLSDLPAGWRQEGTVWLGDSSSTAAAKSFSAPLSESPDLARCAGVREAPVAVAAEAGSPTFTDSGDTLLVDDAADVYGTVGAATENFPPVKTPAFPACFLASYRSEIIDLVTSVSGAGTAVGKIGASARTYPAFGDQSGAVELSASVTVAGDTYSEYLDFLFIRRGRSVTTLTLDNADAPFPAALAGQLAARVLARMSA